MKATELRKEVQEYILSELQTSVMRLGINAQLSLTIHKNYRGEEVLAIESTKFQTMPVMFKEIYLEGRISVFDEKDDIYEVCVDMDYRWSLFREGSNGTELGRCYFDVDKELPKGLTAENVKHYVHKSKGMEI